MKGRKSLRWLGTIAVTVSFLAPSGCAWLSNRSTPPPNPISQQQPAASSSAEPAVQPMYYDFNDIPIPQELSLVRDDSYVFQSNEFRAGLLTLKGRVDLNSLINFFQTALPRQGWTPKGGFRYRRSILIFEKSDRSCIINIYDKLFQTYVEIYVAPADSRV